MRNRFSTLLVLAALCGHPITATEPSASVDSIVDDYIEAWKGFYPSRAFSLGFLESIAGFEDYSSAAIGEWIAFNERAMDRFDALSDLPRDGHLDARLLRTQICTELERWRNDRPQESSLGLYASRISRALSPILESPLLSTDEKRRLLFVRLQQIGDLAVAAQVSLREGRSEETRQAIDSLRVTADHLQTGLAQDAAAIVDGTSAAELEAAGSRAASAIGALIEQVETELLPPLTLPDEPILGRENYARKLAIYTDSDLTPEQLEEMAWQEIQASKAALHEMAAAYWTETDPSTPVPEDFETLVGRAFDDLESNRPAAEQEYLLELRRYGQEVEDFVRDHEIATVPEHQTLSIELAPESAGPMARIGYVSSAPAFHPNPWTTWYLATIPDSHPEQERIDFWRSFNYSFKRFIVIHELFPGHYMQLKILRENPHRVRILFPYRPFIEGWATFTERIVLDAGYADGDWLTRFAQLRKRLENANRAYTSVQAHCNGWTEEQVTEFSIETSLLAPQFAKSLWGRLMSSPMQIITYMFVGIELREIYEIERERLGNAFVLKDFMDTILRTGPVPSEELAAILRAQTAPAGR